MLKVIILLSSFVFSHNVTCCFNMYEKITELYVNEKNIINDVYISNENKYFTFEEPKNANNNILAMKGYNRNEMLIATIRMSCKSTNNTSLWNIRTNDDKTWKIVKNSIYSPIADMIDKEYYFYNYTKRLFNPDLVPDVMPYANFVIRFNFSNDICLPSAKHLRIFKNGLSPERWFAIRFKI